MNECSSFSYRQKMDVPVWQSCWAWCLVPSQVYVRARLCFQKNMKIIITFYSQSPLFRGAYHIYHGALKDCAQNTELLVIQHTLSFSPLSFPLAFSPSTSIPLSLAHSLSPSPSLPLSCSFSPLSSIDLQCSVCWWMCSAELRTVPVEQLWRVGWWRGRDAGAGTDYRY